ncbi:NADH:ubiquinone reductase (Na(+)-transporting) subunit B [Salinisphaera sp. P385]|uniref:Na(+)-translocating NADH-quinone reductase subunit B n=1 Tax=Spectribacter acetivorans TaxID=3075603 RepID=A0ABU3B606_9GAMM|nr:NADH:ubiquinone reductase (Na(+)-transporting) subunit B [Salinisphaera sp. P385]MDT0617860.1 NADH:ubiquinone reductase (Na(+)-transporting) subunit B [Salinisphaera sp. P385]
MSALRNYLDRLHPLFAKGGKLEKYYALYEMVDTFFYSPSDTTRGAPHVRDGIDLKRVMIYVWLATVPCMFMACWNTGFQANQAMAAMGLDDVEGWRQIPLHLFGVSYDPTSFWDNFVHGLWYFLPAYMVTFIVGGLWEVLFAAVRNHEINEGFFATSILFTLTLPPDIPLWQVAMGISFGVVVGKEVFGGTGKNFLNPALTGRAFLFFTFPAYMSGDAVWTAVDGYTGATALGIGATEGMAGIVNQMTWWDAFLGDIQGSLGSTSTLAILLGAAFLLYTRVASWRIMAGCVVGLVASTWLFGLIGSDTNPMFSVPWYWHLVLGGFAFGAVYMATDPVSAAMTNKGRFYYGVLIGFMTALIRVVNPAYPEGIMLAILFANIFAPLIDYFVTQANIKRRQARLAAANGESPQTESTASQQQPAEAS